MVRAKNSKLSLNANASNKKSKNCSNTLERLFQRRPSFFVVVRRTKEVLHDIIKANVRRGTTIFTDEWCGYSGLENEGYCHKTICHKRRFSRFEIDGTTAIKITTNHIERVWVELRKTMKHTDQESFIRFINLETYWQLKLYNEDNHINFVTLLRDFVK